ncbi:MAG: type II and III secretion system protein family protein [Rhodoferax sp.]|uniref:type II and III secretion system protein family protein n=1 Tax=Rhodoferax sp. TaxID=50421 RepID=UPI00179305E7|nr:type II and III secretion system protein family protein [Rhodoferax sp.]NMM20017.1 type II and III secretion system protein family protein [Rhodoferax sp.]
MKKTSHTEIMVAAWMLATSATLGMTGPVQAQTQTQKKVVIKGNTATTSPVSAASSTDFATVGPALELVIGKSTLMRLPSPIERISVGNPNIADVSLISPVELYLLGKNYGSTNLVIWRKGGATTAIDVNVSIDADRMEKKLRELLPDEKGIQVRPAADSVILTGVVSSAMKAKYAEDIANAFVREINKNLVLPVTAGDVKVKAGTTIAVGGEGSAGVGGGAKVVNLLQVAQAQQVMLEVKVAEVSKTLLDKLGANLNVSGGVGMTYGVLSNFLSGGAGKFSIKADNGNILTLDAEKKDGLIKVLAEPNIISISGQEASFLAGGKIFIPVARSNGVGGTTITLEEKEFGVGLKFTPTVLEGGRIHLQVAPEVSELSQTGSPFTSVDGTTSILPSVTTRRVQTTVQLMDGQTFAIAGLIKNNVSESVKRVPLFGEIPILGALFRSSEFQNDRTELMFLITPRLVKPLDSNYILPTDNFTPPSRSEYFLGNKLEGSGNGDVPADKRSKPAPQPQVPQPQSGGFEVK